jgi:hypothetical protein
MLGKMNGYYKYVLKRQYNLCPYYPNTLCWAVIHNAFGISLPAPLPCGEGLGERSRKLKINQQIYSSS